MRFYKNITKQRYENAGYAIVPLRDEDRMDIMKWRNEQVFHLRQSKKLTAEDQHLYFDTVVRNLFIKDEPDQLLFSYLHNDTCIGYGGLVHINYRDKHAEISFIIDTEREKDQFSFHWSNYLTMIEEVAFRELRLHKIFTYAFDLRPHLYKVLLNEGFSEEARLKEHIYFEGNYIDVLIHSKFNDI